MHLLLNALISFILVASCRSAPITCGLNFYTNSVVNEDAADPGLTYDVTTGLYYQVTTGFTTSPSFGAFPLRSSPDLVTWSLVGFAMTEQPAWAGVSAYWAPELYIIEGTWMLLYSAKDTSGKFCVGIAYSSATGGGIVGTYIDFGLPLISDPRLVANILNLCLA